MNSIAARRIPMRPARPARARSRGQPCRGSERGRQSRRVGGRGRAHAPAAMGGDRAAEQDQARDSRAAHADVHKLRSDDRPGPQGPEPVSFGSSRRT
ncbi:hypothetical protein E8E01_14795 [Methylorubrum populi]|nr:hypothetical protein E8E01_14795 [Methylorubrum populi]